MEPHTRLKAQVFTVLCVVCATVGLPHVPLPKGLHSESFAVPPLPSKLSGQAEEKHGDDAEMKVPPRELHNLLGPEDLQYYFNTNIRQNVPEYIVTSPVRVPGCRHKRSADKVKDNNFLEFKLHAFGEDFHLVLTHNNRLLAPGCVLHRVNNGTVQMSSCVDSNQDRMTQDADNDCFYIGKSLTHNGSTVAVSTCDGLHGLISVPSIGHDLVIKPVKGQHSGRARRSTGAHNPHIVYRRKSSSRGACSEHLQTDEDLAALFSDLPMSNSASTGSTHKVIRRSAGNDLHLELA
ncbi:A disintegrin and metalloproteinase with thrombospondin motifs 3, partial [Aplysia californica]|uniref:A disintegrin and metalloproteinase with thrombospondin motifs 3 n=1 Tax=Aplysia californica TaxID=6500 RepID=A0ABM1AFZ8_APLCA